VKGSGNIVLNPAVVKGEGKHRKKNERGLHEDRVMAKLHLLHGGHLCLLLQFAAGTRQLVHCGLKLKRRGIGAVRTIGPGWRINSGQVLLAAYEDPKARVP